MKIILFTETISPYRIPVFNEIAQDLKDRFLVLFLGETEKRRQWKIYKEKIKFQYEVLPGFLFQRKDFEPHFFNPTVFHKLMEYSPDIIVVGGYHHFGYFLAMLYARLFKRKIILWFESNRYEYEKRSNSLLKEVYKRWFVRNSTGHIVPGKASFEYLLSLGAVKDKIWIAPNAVDNEYFTQVCDAYRETKEIFKQLKGYPDRLILYVGHLIDKKGAFDLLKAFQILSYKQTDVGLLFIGSGKEEERYKNFCKTNNLKNVFFEGFIHQEDLPVYYAIADVFTLPTHSDAWGLALNEAMASKLPVISSEAAGAAYDLIHPGENGYVFKRGDIQQLVNHLKDILGDEEKRISMGQVSFGIIQDYSPLKCAEGIIKAIREI